MVTPTPYDTGILLPGPARRLLDMWVPLDALSEIKDPGAVAPLLVRWLYDAFDTDTNLSTAVVQRLKDAVYTNAENEVSFDTTAIHAGCSTRWFDDVSLPLWNRSELDYEHPMLAIRPHVRWRLWPRSDEPQGRTATRKRPRTEPMPLEFSEFSRGCLQLVYDFCCLTEHAEMLGHNPVPRPNQGKYMSVEWRFPNGKHAEVPWAGPVFDTFWEANRFASAWNYVVSQYDDARLGMTSTEPVTDVLGVNWIAIATHALVGTQELAAHEVGHGPWIMKALGIKPARLARIGRLRESGPDRKKAIKDCCRTLRGITRQRMKSYVVDEGTASAAAATQPKRAWRVWGWLWNLVALLAPESGLPEDIAQVFFGAKCAGEDAVKDQAALEEDRSFVARFCSDPRHASRIRRIRAWLTRSAWGKTDSDRAFETVTALVNPYRFAMQCRELLQAVASRLPQDSPGRNVAQDLMYALDLVGDLGTANSVMSAFDEVIVALVTSDVEPLLSVAWRDQLRTAKQCIPLWWYSRNHPVNKIRELCPEAGDVPRSAKREGLWSVTVI